MLWMDIFRISSIRLRGDSLGTPPRSPPCKKSSPSTIVALRKRLASFTTRAGLDKFKFPDKYSIRQMREVDLESSSATSS